jgi:uncharacterized protein (UPF0335 family)
MSEANIATEQLRLLIERVERLEEEKKGIGDDIKRHLSESKAHRLRSQNHASDRAPAQNADP